MSTEALAPPPPAPCLTRSYKSRGVKGGTVIAEDVRDAQTHRQRLLDPDDYRRAIVACWACGSSVLHAHAFRQRQLRPADRFGSPPRQETIRLYRCAVKACRAVFTVLPAFIARHLWRAWETVDAVAREQARAPETTTRRWRARLRSDASQLTQAVCAVSVGAVSAETIAAARDADTRAEFVRRVAAVDAAAGERPLARVAAWIHRLVPGLRLE